MHINWSMLRKPWLNQVNSCSTPKDFARVMIVLMSCIKPVVYAPVWHEQLGKYCTSLLNIISILTY
jgi:nucleosome-remodeling factor subunit BPTF